MFTCSLLHGITSLVITLVQSLCFIFIYQEQTKLTLPVAHKTFADTMSRQNNLKTHSQLLLSTSTQIFNIFNTQMTNFTIYYHYSLVTLELSCALPLRCQKKKANLSGLSWNNSPFFCTCTVWLAVIAKLSAASLQHKWLSVGERKKSYLNCLLFSLLLLPFKKSVVVSQHLRLVSTISFIL